LRPAERNGTDVQLVKLAWSVRKITTQTSGATVAISLDADSRNNDHLLKENDMDPVNTTLVAAFVIGAAKGATKVGEKAVIDAYAGLKSVVKSSYHQATELLTSITALEMKPESSGRRETLVEELVAAGAGNDEKLLAHAEAVIAAAEESDCAQTIGVDWRDVRAARLRVGQIRARSGAIGFRAARMEITEEVEITGIDVGEQPGK